jgi:hypothetical protein
MGDNENPERYVKAAMCAHAKIRAEGRVPGQEARAARWDCSTPERTPKALRQITRLSGSTAHEKGPDGLTKEQRGANERLKKHWAEIEAARVERNRQEWLDKQRRLQAPGRIGREICITGSMSMPY